MHEPSATAPASADLGFVEALIACRAPEPHEAALAAATNERDAIAWERKVVSAARAYRAAWLRANAGGKDVLEDVPMQALALMSAIVL